MPRFLPPRARVNARTRGRTDRRKRWGASGVALVALVGLVLGLPVAEVPPIPAPASATEPEASETAEAAATPEIAPHLQVAPIESQLTDGDDDVEFIVRVENPGAEALPGGRVVLTLSLEPVVGADDLAADADLATASLGAYDVGETGAEGDQTLTLAVPRNDLRLTQRSPAGVYRVAATFEPEIVDEGASAPDENPEVTGSDTSLTAATAVVWRGTGTIHDVALSMIVPLVLPSDSQTMPSKSQLGDAADRLDRLVDTAEATGATLAIDPRIIAGIRAYGAEAPDSARDLLTRLETTPAPNFLLQFADADPAAQAATGLDELLAPTDLSFVTRNGSFPVEDDTGEPTPATPDASADGGAAPSPDAGADPGAEADEADPEASAGPDAGADEQTEGPPSLDELLAWTPATPATRTAWPAAGAVDPATLTLLTDSGYDSLVLDSSNVSGATAPIVSISGMQTTVTDAALGEAVRSALSSDSETERLSGIASASAQLALLAQQDADGLVIAVDRAAIADSTEAAETLALLADLDWVAPVPVSEQAEGTGSLRAGGTHEDRAAQLRTALVREAQVDEMSILLEDPVYLTGYQRARLLVFFSAAHAVPSADFSSIADRYRARDAELLEGVHVILGSHAQLVGTSSRVPVQVHNSLPFDAIVTGEARPASAAIRVNERELAPTTIPADGNATVLVPVQTRVSSGTSGLLVTLSDRAGTREFFTGVIPLSISSAVETIALSVLGVLATLLLGFGVWRSVRRRADGVSEADDTDSMSAAEDSGDAQHS